MDKRLFWLQVASLAVVTGVSLAAIPYAEQIRENAGPAYLALFLLSVQSGALFMLPGFGWASIAVFAVAFDNVWGPVLVGTTGQVVGEMVSYLLGVTGSPWIQRRKSYQRVEAWIKPLGAAGDLCDRGPAEPVLRPGGRHRRRGAAGLVALLHRVVGRAPDQEHRLRGGRRAERGLHPAVLLGVV